MSSWTPKASAAVCAAQIARAEYEDDHIIRWEWLCTVGDIPAEPDPFRVIVFRDDLTRLVLKQTGRYLRPQHGVGYILCGAEHSAEEILQRGINQAITKIDKAGSRVKAQRTDMLSSGARQRREEMRITAAALKGALKARRPMPSRDIDPEPTTAGHGLGPVGVR